MPLQIRRGTNAERLILASPLVSGELLWIVDDQRLYIGDGTTLARDLAPVTGYNDDDAKDAAASIFTSGTHSGISFTYDGSTSIDATVSLPALLENLSTNGFDITGDGNINITGSVTATSFTGDYKGSISADDSTILVDALNGSINLSGTVKGDVIPDQNEAYDLGSASNRFKDLYLSGTSLYLGSAQITASGAAVDLPAGSTINGVLISDKESGVVAGSDYNINIVGDDSSSIINSSTRAVSASGGFFGNLTGNVTGDLTGTVSGRLIGDVNGSVYADDSTLLIDGTEGRIVGPVFANVTGNLTGNVTGDVTGNLSGIVYGDLIGSVFADDSSLIVDAIDKSINSNDITTILGLYIFSDADFIATRIAGLSNGANYPTLQIHGFDGSRENPTTVSANQFVSSLEFTVQRTAGQPRDNGKSIANFIAQTDSSADMSDDAPAANLFLTVGANDGQGDDATTNYRFFEWQQDGSFSSKIITHRAQTGAEIAAITPVAGMVVFNSTTQKFRGYVDDTGLAGGGAPNATPGWIDLH